MNKTGVFISPSRFINTFFDPFFIHGKENLGKDIQVYLCNSKKVNQGRLEKHPSWGDTVGTRLGLKFHSKQRGGVLINGKGRELRKQIFLVVFFPGINWTLGYIIGYDLDK